MPDQHQKGIATIRTALETMLSERAVAHAVVNQNIDSAEPQDVQFSITVDGKTEEQHFTRQEIEDSALAIDAPAALKVRMLVSHFVR